MTIRVLCLCAALAAAMRCRLPKYQGVASFLELISLDRIFQDWIA